MACADVGKNALHEKHDLSQNAHGDCRWAVFARQMAVRSNWRSKEPKQRSRIRNM